MTRSLLLLLAGALPGLVGCGKAAGRAMIEALGEAGGKSPSCTSNRRNPVNSA